MTNSERRISRVRAAVAPPGEARADWAIAVRFRAPARSAAAPGRADALSLRHGRARSSTSTWRRRAGAISTSPVSRTRGSTRRARSSGRCREGDAQGTARLYTDGRFATRGRPRALRRGRRTRPVAEKRRRALSVPPDHRAPARPVARHEPHRQIASLFAHAPEPRSSCILPTCAARTRATAISCASNRGAAASSCRSRRPAICKPGGAYLPMHWGVAHARGTRQRRHQRA